jgi:hypothetical protein
MDFKFEVYIFQCRIPCRREGERGRGGEEREGSAIIGIIIGFIAWTSRVIIKTAMDFKFEVSIFQCRIPCARVRRKGERGRGGEGEKREGAHPSLGS